jgi:hypothetical protein
MLLYNNRDNRNHHHDGPQERQTTTVRNARPNVDELVHFQRQRFKAQYLPWMPNLTQTRRRSLFAPTRPQNKTMTKKWVSMI